MTEWSEYQKQAINFVENCSGHGAIVSVAGSGKSTTLEECISKVPKHKKTLVLAFNKAIQVEMTNRLGKRNLNCTVKTYNSFCNSILITNELIPPHFDENKTQHIFDKSPYRERTDIDYAVIRAVSLLKNKAVFNLDLKYLIPAIDAEELSEVEDFAEIAARIFIECVNTRSFIDYDDQKYYVVKEGYNVPKYDYVFVDEYQDTCPIESMIIDKLIAKKARVIISADPDQAIYSFKGTERNSVDNFIKKNNATELQLSICYRCSVAVVEEAKKIVPRIEAADFANAGEAKVLTFEEFHDKVHFDDLILGRTYTSLVSSCTQFFKRDRNAYIEGKKVTGGLFNFLRVVSNGDDGSLDVDEFVDMMVDYYAKVKKILTERGKLKQLSELTDWYECVHILTDDPEILTLGELRYKAYNLFKVSKDSKFRHMTIHKSKGLEGKKGANVFLLDYNKLEQTEEERRLQYVAITRSKMGGFYYVESQK